MAAREKTVEVNGQVYYRRLTAGQMQDNARQLDELSQTLEAAETPEATRDTLARLQELATRVVRESVVGYLDEDVDPPERREAGENPLDVIDGSDAQELFLHCCGEVRKAVRVVGAAPLAPSPTPPTSIGPAEDS